MAESEGNRFGELWLPISVILNLVEADASEVSEIKQYCEMQHSINRFELNDWDYILVEIVANLEDEEISAEDLLSTLQAEIPSSYDDKKPGKQWLGKAMKRLGLIKEKKGNKHKTIYIVDKEQASKLLGGNEIIGGSGLE